MLASSLRSKWFPALIPAPDDLQQLHENTSAALRYVPLALLDSLASVDVIYFYVDGSGGSGDSPAASWSFMVLSETRDAHSLHGFYSGMVVTDDARCDYIGAAVANSSTGELSALAWLMLWILSSTELLSQNTKYYVCYDSEFAAGVASSLFCPQVEKTLVHFLASLVNAVM
eukprot:10303422-Karenia_brevis.AAC.1